MVAKFDIWTRPMEECDIERVTELLSQLGYESSAAEVANRFRQIEEDKERHRIILVCAVPKEILGGVHVFIRPPILEMDSSAEIGGIVVDKNFRDQGIDTLLMEKAEQWARGKGCGEMRLRSNVIRQVAHKFYEGLGYKLIKTQHTFSKALK